MDSVYINRLEDYSEVEEIKQVLEEEFDTNYLIKKDGEILYIINNFAVKYFGDEVVCATASNRLWVPAAPTFSSVYNRQYGGTAVHFKKK